MKAKRAELTIPRFVGSWPDNNTGIHVVSDDQGRLWRLDVRDGSVRRVVVETPAKPPKPERK